METGVGNLPWRGLWVHVGTLSSAAQTTKRTDPQTRNQSRGAGKRRFAPDHQPARCVLDPASVITTVGFIFHRDEQKRERGYQRLEFSFTSMAVFSPRLL